MKKFILTIIDSLNENKGVLARILMIVLSIMLGVCCFGAESISAKSNAELDTRDFNEISNLGSGKELNVRGNGNTKKTNIDTYEWDGTDGQRFKFCPQDGGYVIIPECGKDEKMVINIYSEKAKNNDNVCLWSRTNHSTQIWIIEYVSKYGAYIFKSKDNPKLVLTCTGNKNSANVNVQTYKGGNNYQLWKIAPSRITSNSAITTEMIDKVIKEYDLYPGNYWTYKGNNSTSYHGNKSGKAGVNGYKGYSFDGGIQCYAFGRFLGSKAANTSIKNFKNIKAKNVTELKVGDIVCTGNNNHTALVYKDLGGGKFEFIECWGSINNKIAVGGFNGTNVRTLKQLKDKGLVYILRYTK